VNGATAGSGVGRHAIEDLRVFGPRAIVDDDDLVGRQRLRAHGGDRFGDEARAVEVGDDD
jgi:hypothetical protein